MNRLASLIEHARHHPMTPDEQFEQMVGFVYGQLLEGDNRNIDEVRASLKQILKHRHEQQRAR